MDPIADLKTDFTMLLQEEFKKQLLPGENVVISLPGSFGEALAVNGVSFADNRFSRRGRRRQRYGFDLPNGDGSTSLFMDGCFENITRRDDEFGFQRRDWRWTTIRNLTEDAGGIGRVS